LASLSPDKAETGVQLSGGEPSRKVVWCIVVTDQFEALVTEVYDAAVDPRLWPIFLERLRTRLGAEFVSIVAIHKPTIRVTHVHHTPWDATAISDLADRQLVRIPMRDKILFGMLDTPVSTLQLMPEQEFQQSSFHREWVAPNGLRDGSTTLIADMAEELITIGFVTSQQRDPVSADEMMLVQRLSPHLRRAFMIGETLERTRWGAEVSLAALSGIATPILISDATGCLIFANPAAEKVLDAEGPLLVRHGRVEPRSPAVRTNFSEALQRATSSDVALGRRGVGVPLLAELEATYAYILPLLGIGTRRVGDQPLVAIFLSTRKGRALPEDAILMTLFDLTPSEARIMSRIADGQSAITLRDELGITANTMKSHLARIFAKTGCGRQADLVKLMSELSLPTRP
jgi:DNA-binding CsgD family transcriptional regulator/PAS domain-containing protein